VAELPEREVESLLRTAGLAGRSEFDSAPDSILDATLEDAVDFSLVHADDEFLDALGAGQPDPDGRFADDRLAALLLSWREDVDAEPIANLVEPKLAVATVRAARARQRRAPRLLAPFAAAAAVLAIAFAGVGLAARGAEPGDTLWGLTRVLYSDHARSVEAAQAVKSDLTKAEAALANGQVTEAKSMLDAARTALPTVASEDGQADLRAQHDALVAQLPESPAAGVLPPPAASPTTLPASGSTVASNPTTTTTTTAPPSVETTTTPAPTTTTTTTTTTEAGRIETDPSAGDENPKSDPGSGAPAVGQRNIEEPETTTP
jgi:hypothetical protein